MKNHDDAEVVYNVQDSGTALDFSSNTALPAAGVNLASGTAGDTAFTAATASADGVTEIGIQVTAQDGTTTNRYIVTLTAKEFSTEAKLSSLMLSDVMLATSFQSGLGVYSASASFSTTMTTLAASPMDVGANVAVTTNPETFPDGPDTDGDAESFVMIQDDGTYKVYITDRGIKAGDGNDRTEVVNVAAITVTVTPESGTDGNMVYTINLTQEGADTDATLEMLETGVLDNNLDDILDFNKSTTSYELSVANDIDSIALTAVPNSSARGTATTPVPSVAVRSGTLENCGQHHDVRHLQHNAPGWAQHHHRHGRLHGHWQQ